MEVADSGEGVVPIPRVLDRVEVQLPVALVPVHVRNVAVPLRAYSLYTESRHDHHPLNILSGLNRIRRHLPPMILYQVPSF